MSKPPDLVQGTLDLLLLKLLALEPLHGWAISQRLKQVSSDILQVSDGSQTPIRVSCTAHGLQTGDYAVARGIWSPGSSPPALNAFSVSSLT